MNVHRAPFACTLLVLIACALFPKVATAQYTGEECLSVNNAILQATREQDSKRLIALERQNLSYCRAYQQGDGYALHLGVLAQALNFDNQHGEALGVANRCLAIDADDFGCLVNKAIALASLGRVSEAKSVVERSLSLSAITESDVGSKEILQKLKE